MRIVSTELRQVFKAYTNQLRGAYPKAGGQERGHNTVARGFEKVDISPEARAMAAQQMNSQNETDSVERKAQKKNEEKSAKEDQSDEQTTETTQQTGARSDRGRSS